VNPAGEGTNGFVRQQRLGESVPSHAKKRARQGRPRQDDLEQKINRKPHTGREQ